MISGTSAKTQPREDSCEPSKIFGTRCVPPLVGGPRAGEGGARELLGIEAVGTLLGIVLQRRNSVQVQDTGLARKFFFFQDTGLARTFFFFQFFLQVKLFIHGIVEKKKRQMNKYMKTSRVT